LRNPTSALIASTCTGTLSCPILTNSVTTATLLPSTCADPALLFSLCAMRPYIALRIGRSVRSISLCRPRVMSSTLILFMCIRLRCTARTHPGIRVSRRPALSRASSVSCKKISKVSSIVNLISKFSSEQTFENLYLP